MSAKEEIGSDKPDGDFFARYLPKKHWDQPWMAAVERVVLVHRLREVVATVGFTRFESSSPDVEGELEIGVTQGPTGTRRLLAAGHREPRRGDLHPVQERGDRRLDGKARGQAARRAAHGRLRLLEEGPRQEQAQVLRAPLHPAPFAVAPADHLGLPRMRLPGELDPGTDLLGPLR